MPRAQQLAGGASKVAPLSLAVALPFCLPFLIFLIFYLAVLSFVFVSVSPLFPPVFSDFFFSCAPPSFFLPFSLSFVLYDYLEFSLSLSPSLLVFFIHIFLCPFSLFSFHFTGYSIFLFLASFPV